MISKLRVEETQDEIQAVNKIKYEEKYAKKKAREKSIQSGWDRETQFREMVTGDSGSRAPGSNSEGVGVVSLTIGYSISVDKMVLEESATHFEGPRVDIIEAAP